MIAIWSRFGSLRSIVTIWWSSIAARPCWSLYLVIIYHCLAMLITLFGDLLPLLRHVDQSIWWSFTAAWSCWSLYLVIIYRCSDMLITLLYLVDHLSLLSHVDHPIWWSSTAAQAVYHSIWWSSTAAQPCWSSRWVSSGSCPAAHSACPPPWNTNKIQYSNSTVFSSHEW